MQEKSVMASLTKGMLALVLSVPAWGEQISGGPIDLGTEPLLSGGAAAYQGTDGLYVLYPGRDQPVPILTGQPGQGKILNPRFAHLGERYRAAWIEKGGEGNRLFVLTAGTDGAFPAEPKPLAAGLPSNSLELAALDGGTLLVVDGAIGKTPSLALARSDDGGATFQRTPVPLREMSQLYSFAVVPDTRVLHIFVHGQTEGRTFIGLLDYRAEGGTLSALETVADTPISSLLVPFRVRGAPALLFKVYQDDHFSLRLAVRGAEGWSTQPVTGADGLDVARVDPHAWPDGRILLAFSGERRGQTKQRVYAALSLDGGTSWTTRPLDSAEQGNTRAWLPQLAVSGDRVAVVWEDARDIRSRIRLQISPDRGASWRAQDLPGSPLPHYGMRPRIQAAGDQLAMAWQQYRSDAKEQADLVLRTLGWDEAAALAEPPETQIGAERKQALLNEAIDSYWRAMAEDDQSAAYGAHDPFYRARVTQAQYAGHRGPIRYHRHELKGTQIQGNEALANVLVNYSVPSLKAFGMEKSVPPTDHLVQDTWLFLDGRWYRKYVDGLSGGSAIQY